MQVLRAPLGSANTQTPAGAMVPGSREARAWSTAQDFEGVFLNTMLAQMFSGLDGGSDDGPMGGRKNEAWRGMLVDEYSKGFAAQGGLGLAPVIYRELLGQQESAGRARAAMARAGTPVPRGAP